MKQVVQINNKADNPLYIGCFMIVNEFKSWGAIGYVPTLSGAYRYKAKNGSYDMIGKTNFYIKET